ncbi:MAG: hypothetical protein HQ580_11875 [Planctomycetes bacterium]|nr:hypothetical protein [Planctomycetota bacterium]
MEQEIDFKEIEQKAFRESNQDGLLELVMGICMAAMSTRLISPVLVFMLALPALLFGPVLVAMRKRFTYPRIGYVKLIPDKPKEVIRAIFLITLIVVVIIAVIFVFFGDVRDFNLWMKWIPVWGGVVLAGMFSSFGSKSGCARYYVFALWSLISGFVLSILNFEAVETGTLLYFLVMGCLLIPWGLVTFIRFLRKSTKRLQEVNDGKE